MLRFFISALLLVGAREIVHYGQRGKMIRTQVLLVPLKRASKITPRPDIRLAARWMT